MLWRTFRHNIDGALKALPCVWPQINICLFHETPMPTKSQNDAMNLYAGLMTEIKVRINAINTGTMNQIPVPPPLVKEFCFLQIRMICELVALGCLVAHGDISDTKNR